MAIEPPASFMARRARQICQALTRSHLGPLGMEQTHEITYDDRPLVRANGFALKLDDRLVFLDPDDVEIVLGDDGQIKGYRVRDPS